MIEAIKSLLSESRNWSPAKLKIEFQRKLQGRLKVWKISIMGIEPAPYTNRTDETFETYKFQPITSFSRLPYISYKDFSFFFFS